MANRKLTQLQLNSAKSRYMNYEPISEIAKSMGLQRGALQYHVDKYWKSERVLRKNEMIAEFSDSKIALINETFSKSYKGVHAWVHKVTQPDYELKPHEVKTLMQIIADMDKITRLDQGSPTDIIADTVPVPVIEIRKKIVNSDPFLQEGEYREITEIQDQDSTSSD